MILLTLSRYVFASLDFRFVPVYFRFVPVDTYVLVKDAEAAATGENEQAVVVDESSGGDEEDSSTSSATSSEADVVGAKEETDVEEAVSSVNGLEGKILLRNPSSSFSKDSSKKTFRNTFIIIFTNRNIINNLNYFVFYRLPNCIPAITLLLTSVKSQLDLS